MGPIKRLVILWVILVILVIGVCVLEQRADPAGYAARQNASEFNAR